MKTRAAVLFEQPGEWRVVEVDLDPPGHGEVLVEIVASGLCHSDDHFATGDALFAALPLCGGHEGAGIVRELGPGVSGLEVGDHVVTSFIPACGQCHPCASGHQELCDNGRILGTGMQLDGTARMHLGGTDVATGASLGTFAEHQVLDQLSCVKIAPDIPLQTAVVVSCGVPTGWGSATRAADLGPGSVVVVMGCGGIGMNAVQGARFMGAGRIVAVDPQPFKRDMALELGATDAFESMAPATEFVRSVTNGQGADAAIITVGVVDGAHIAEGFSAIRKKGTVVVTAVGGSADATIPVNLTELSMFEKRIQGVVYGNVSPRVVIPELLGLHRTGALDLDRLITRRYTLDEINEGYADMHAGHNIRGVITF